jgi:glycerol-3-phosphate dehydrogenase
MQRDLSKLANETFDLLIIGAGIHGATIAWDATLRGLSVALVDRADFGSATSANSLKTVHGGLRYLQDANLGLVRTMVRERRALLRIAPHLVHPLPCIMPTYSRFRQSKAVISAALLLNDLAGIDRNREVDPFNHLPRSRIISREECLTYLPGIAEEGITGGALWYDGQIYNTERLTLSFVSSAADSGAAIANYVEAMGLLRDENRVIGIRAKDVLKDQEFEIRAKVVVSATGPWVDSFLDRSGIPDHPRKFNHSLAMNLVTRKLIPEYAAGIFSRPKDGVGNQSGSKKSRLLFIAPWREYSIIGTLHAHYSGQSDEFVVKENYIDHFIAEINSAYPDARLERGDILFIHSGLLPEWKSANMKQVNLVREGRIYDHERDNSVLGLITVVGVKYTSARYLAQKTVNLVFQKLGKDVPKCRTDITPLCDGKIDDFTRFLSEERKHTANGFSEDTTRHLIYNYGSNYPRLTNLLSEDQHLGQALDESSRVMTAEILYGIRYEMAKKLSDIIFRRTELGSAGYPGRAAIEACAAVMAKEMGWNRIKTQEEIDHVLSIFRSKTMGLV